MKTISDFPQYSWVEVHDHGAAPRTVEVEAYARGNWLMAVMDGEVVSKRFIRDPSFNLAVFRKHEYLDFAELKFLEFNSLQGYSSLKSRVWRGGNNVTVRVQGRDKNCEECPIQETSSSYYDHYDEELRLDLG